jgi:type IV pilus assembly protein PilA
MKGIKTNNKGFSLVELIIVIAIMAILVAVLAPQYLKYVERSRYSRDVQTVDQLYTAVQAACAEPDADIADQNIEFKTVGSEVKAVWSKTDDDLYSTVKDSFGDIDPTPTLSSKEWGSTKTMPKITVDKGVAKINNYEAAPSASPAPAGP